MPKLTVLMPVYNGARFLKESIESVLNQTFGDYELLIIDDKSQDNSKDIIFSYRDKRIRFIQNKKNLGQMQTLNVGIKLSRGQYIARMDQDDTSLPERFEKEIEVLDKRSDVELVYSDSFIIDENGRKRDKTLFYYSKPHRAFVFDKLLKRNFITGNTVMIRKRTFESIGLYNPSYNIAAEYDLYLRLAQKRNVDFIDKPLAGYRVHEKNASAITSAEKRTKEIIELLSSLDRNTMNRCYKTILDKMISWHIAGLAMIYLFQYNRKLCRARAKDSLKINPFDAKALAAIFMAIFFPRMLIDFTGSFRRKWFEE